MRTYWIIGIMMATGLPIHAKECSVDVHVVAGVAMPDGMLPAPAERQTIAMFRAIGVKLRMRSANHTADEKDSCGAPIVIQLEESTSYPGTPEALAYAAPYLESGTCIHIFIDRIIQRTREAAAINVLLAHVMAHEITHVLERSLQHSAEGVMKARWTRKDYELMNWRPLRFSPGDVECVREGVTRRISQGTHAHTHNGNSPT